MWENDDAAVVNKPSGLVCVREERPKEWPVAAHRLDKETSGVLLLAKNPKSLRFLMSQFKRRKIDKEYLVLVHGWIEPKEGRLRLPLGRKTGSLLRSVRYDGKMADTAWKRIKRLVKGGEKLSLLKIKTYTGRTHQIRVHLAHLGYPVFSDGRYLSKSQMIKDRRILDRQFLHAYKIGFDLLNGRRQEVTTGLSRRLLRVLEK